MADNRRFLVMFGIACCLFLGFPGPVGSQDVETWHATPIEEFRMVDAGSEVICLAQVFFAHTDID